MRNKDERRRKRRENEKRIIDRGEERKFEEKGRIVKESENTIN